MLEISTFTGNCPGRLRVRTTGEALTFGLICPTMSEYRESKTLPAKIKFAPSPFSSVRQPGAPLMESVLGLRLYHPAPRG